MYNPNVGDTIKLKDYSHYVDWNEHINEIGIISEDYGAVAKNRRE